MEEWRVLPYGRLDAPHNMAVDEALLRCHTGESNPPTLRLYGWKRPAVSVGYFQKTALAVNSRWCSAEGIAIVRRPTGGRAVCHGRDLTYAVVSRDGDARFSGGIMETYRTLSECIRRGLAHAGIETAVAQAGGGGDGHGGGGCCFSVPAQYELLAGGKKICGSAQMRMRGAFLQHGSIPLSLDARRMCLAMNHAGAGAVARLKERVTAVDEHAPAGLSVEMLCRHIERGFEECLGVRLVPGVLTDGETEETERLLAEKYLTEAWNREGRAEHEDS